MPELPEVETVVRTLEDKIQDLEIVDIQILYEKMIIGSIDEFKNQLMHEHFRKFSRRGKYLIFYMDNIVLVSHLRMEGKYFYVEQSMPIDKHTHVIFALSNGKELRYHDTRKFGRMELYPIDYDFNLLHDLGPEPFTDNFNKEYVYEICHHKSIPIKSLLLEQSFVAGIGNIYADEILFACVIRPMRNTQKISKKDAEHIVLETRRILSEAILAGGTTIRSYTSSLGVTGKFQLSCNVHTQEKCRVCNEVIKVKWIRGRSSYYCPKCQKR